MDRGMEGMNVDEVSAPEDVNMGEEQPEGEDVSDVRNAMEGLLKQVEDGSMSKRDAIVQLIQDLQGMAQGKQAKTGLKDRRIMPNKSMGMSEQPKEQEGY